MQESIHHRTKGTSQNLVANQACPYPEVVIAYKHGQISNSTMLLGFLFSRYHAPRLLISHDNLTNIASVLSEKLSL